MSAFVTSRLDYCNSLLNACISRRLNRFQRILNVCARLIKLLPRRSSTSSVLRQLEWLPVRSRVTFKLACLVHKCLYGVAPNYLRELLLLAPSSSVRIHLRSQCAVRLFEPSYNRQSYRGAFQFCAPRIWNRLSNECRREMNYKRFRRCLKNELLD